MTALTRVCDGGEFESKKDSVMGVNGRAEWVVTGQRGLAHTFRHPQDEDRADRIRVLWNPALQIANYVLFYQK